MLEEVNRLTRLVDNLLTLSRADAGAVPFQRSRFAVLELANEALGLLHVLIEEKSQTVLLTGGADIEMEGDRLFLRQALLNVLHNAVQYCPSGAAINVSVRRTGEGQVLLEISDNGPGIPAEHARHIFDRFYRVDKSRSRQRGGAGLGLSIAQWAVQAHGGQIALDSKPGFGATFRIFIPAISPHKAITE
jgi:signal transduction histidine kinase